jgi:uncharacterized membrane protein
MTLPLLLKLVHVASAIWFIAGLVGRQVVLAQAARATDLSFAARLSDVAGIFETKMVVPGSLVVLVAGLVTAWAQGWPILGFIQGSQTNWLLVSLLLYVTLIPIVPLIFLPRGRKFAAALADAQARGEFTPELKAAFHDPVVAAAHLYEMAVVVVIVILMVLKPF